MAMAMPNWALDNIRKGIERNLDIAEDRCGIKMPILRSRLPSMGEDELAEVILLTEQIASADDMEYKIAREILPIDWYIKLARRRHGSKKHPKKRIRT